MEWIFELLKGKVLGLVKVEVSTDFLKSGLNFGFEVDLLELGPLEVFNGLDVLELMTDVLDGDVAFDVANAVLLEFIVKDPLHFSIFSWIST